MLEPSLAHEDLHGERHEQQEHDQLVEMDRRRTNWNSNAVEDDEKGERVEKRAPPAEDRQQQQRRRYQRQQDDYEERHGVGSKVIPEERDTRPGGSSPEELTEQTSRAAASDLVLGSQLRHDLGRFGAATMAAAAFGAVQLFIIPRRVDVETYGAYR